MTIPITTGPAEVLDISPEALEIANCYLQLQSLDATAESMDVPKEQVTKVLARKEVKAYIDHVFMNSGFNNRFRMRAAMDAIIKKKFQELEESETGSAKDIAELLALSHKMTMDELSRQMEYEKLRQSSVKTQTNIQINDQGGTKYEALIHKLLNNGS